MTWRATSAQQDLPESVQPSPAPLSMSDAIDLTSLYRRKLKLKTKCESTSSYHRFNQAPHVIA